MVAGTAVLLNIILVCYYSSQMFEHCHIFKESSGLEPQTGPDMKTERI
jgi:hypothetical protein